MEPSLALKPKQTYTKYKVMKQKLDGNKLKILWMIFTKKIKKKKKILPHCFHLVLIHLGCFSQTKIILHLTIKI